jgi:nicotinate-nucleotide--dimethylbenzimidazole phosphoribosyltransferase
MTQPIVLNRFADLPALAARLPAFDQAAAAAVRAREAELTKPAGALGRLEELTEFIAGWQGVERPRAAKAQALVFAGNHGVCAQGVNPYPQEVTAQMVANFAAGGAAINQLCQVAGAALSVVPLDLDRPTADFTQGDALSEAEVTAAVTRGAESVDPSADVLLLGEMGIGNSTVAAALAALHLGGAPEVWVGPGAGADDAVLARKRAAVAAGIHRHAGRTGLDALAAIGGREQAALCGAVLAARAARIPVLLDGFICTAAVLPLRAEAAGLLDHCLVGHASAEPGHAPMLAALGMRPLLDLGLRLGEGTGAALALGVLRGAVACHDGMATFAEAGIGGQGAKRIDSVKE